MLRRPHVLPALLTACIALAVPAATHAADVGELDPAFGTGGLRFDDPRPGTVQAGLGTAAALGRADGSTLVAGTDGGTGALTVTHLLADGTIDPAFGGTTPGAVGGFRTIDLYPGNGNDDIPTALAADSQGRILVSGRTGGRGWIVRLTPGGVPDPSFDGDGIVLDESDAITDIAVDTDDAVYAAASSAPASVQRFTAAGAPDTAFGTSSIEVLPAGTQYPRIGLAGRRPIVGGSINGNGYRVLELQSVLDAHPGQPYDPFGASGRIELPASGTVTGDLLDLAVDPTGGVYLLGDGLSDGYELWHFTASGGNDGSFGAGGRVTRSATASTSDHPVALTTTSAGKAVVLGQNGSTNAPWVELLGLDGAADPGFGGIRQPGCVTGSYCPPTDVTISGSDITLLGDAGGYGMAARYKPSGTLVASFSGDGLASFSQTRGWPVTLTDVATDPTGAVYILGEEGRYNDESTFLLKQLPDGRLDPSFGTGGVIVTDLEPGMPEYTGSLARGADGALYVVRGIGGGTFKLTRFTATGLDTGYGTGGTRTVSIDPGGSIYVFDTTTDSAGRLVAAGSDSFAGGSQERGWVTRIDLATGALDPSFNGGTPAWIDTVPGTDQERPERVTITPNGQIAVAGSVGFDPMVAKLNADGSFVSGFGTAGIAKLTASLGPIASGYPTAIAATGDQLIYADQFNVSGTATQRIVRVTSSGAVDPSFGTAGIATITSGTAEVDLTEIAVDTAGRLVAVGWRGTFSSRASLAVRLTPAGQRDEAFGPSGERIVDTSGAQSDMFGRVLLRGRSILAVGVGTDEATLRQRVVSAQLIGDPAPASTPAPTATPRPTRTPAPAVRSTITTPKAKAKLRRSRLLTISGTAAGTGGTVRKVEVSLRRIVRGRCAWLRNAKGAFASSKAKKGKCTTVRWVTATGTTTWKLKLKGELPKGSYQLTSRATLSTGLVEQPAKARTFTVR